MKPALLLSLPLLTAPPCQAAVSILVEPGPTSLTTFLTVTETSPSPLLSVQELAGYALAMSLPSAMFNTAIFGEDASSDIYGTLENSVATVTESFSGRTFFLTELQVSADPSAPSWLGFDRLFTLPTGHPSVQFKTITAGRVVTSISPDALNPGVFTVGDAFFGTVTVTVIPEPSGLTLLAMGSAALAARRWRCGPGPEAEGI